MEPCASLWSDVFSKTWSIVEMLMELVFCNTALSRLIPSQICLKAKAWQSPFCKFLALGYHWAFFLCHPCEVVVQSYTEKSKVCLQYVQNKIQLRLTQFCNFGSEYMSVFPSKGLDNGKDCRARSIRLYQAASLHCEAMFDNIVYNSGLYIIWDRLVSSCSLTFSSYSPTTHLHSTCSSSSSSCLSSSSSSMKLTLHILLLIYLHVHITNGTCPGLFSHICQHSQS